MRMHAQTNLVKMRVSATRMRTASNVNANMDSMEELVSIITLTLVSVCVQPIVEIQKTISALSTFSRFKVSVFNLSSMETT